MKRHFENLTRRAARAVQHWWLLMLAGILCFAVGIIVFAFPLESYVVLSIIFGVMVLVVGAAQLLIASTSDNYFMMRGYMIMGGVIDVLLGLFLCIYPGVTLLALPVLMGLWLLYHSFMTIAFGGDLDTFMVPGGNTMIGAGIVLLVLSILILVNPMKIGVATIVIIAGIGLLLLGAVLFYIAMKLKNIDKVIGEE